MLFGYENCYFFVQVDLQLIIIRLIFEYINNINIPMIDNQ